MGRVCFVIFAIGLEKEIAKMKTWVLLVSLLVLLALVSVLVGVGTWHIAYEEASFLGAIREQRAITTGKNKCREYIKTLLQQQSKHMKQIQESFQNKIKVHIGVVGLDMYGDQIVKESVSDLMKDNLSRFQFETLSLRQSKKSIIEQAQELHHSLKVQVFVGPATENQLTPLLVWARTRPHPRPLLVFITPAFITDNALLEKQANDSHAVIQVKFQYSTILQAALHQMYKQDVNKVLILGNSTDNQLERQLQKLENTLNDIKVTPVVLQYSHHPQLVESLEKEVNLFLEESPESSVGLLITENYLFAELVKATVNSPIFSVPWFTTTQAVLYNTHLVNSVLFELQDFNFSYALYEGYAVKNWEWRIDVSNRVKENGISASDYNSDNLDVIYDSVIIASHIGSWLAKDQEISLENLVKRVSWESSIWAGMSGLLKITETLERRPHYFWDFRYLNSLTGQGIRFPSGLWQVQGYIDNKDFP